MNRYDTSHAPSQHRPAAWRLSVAFIVATTMACSLFVGTNVALAADDHENTSSTTTSATAQTADTTAEQGTESTAEATEPASATAKAATTESATATDTADAGTADTDTAPAAAPPAANASETPTNPDANADNSANQADATATNEDTAAGCWVDLSSSENTAAGTQSAPYKTITQALKTTPACSTIYLQGNGTTSAVTIPSGTTLELVGDVTLTGTGKNDGLTIASGATLKAGAHTLTMSKYGTALKVNKEATVADGHYVLSDKLVLAGLVKGSSRAALTLKVTGEYDVKGTSRIEHATVDVYGVNDYRSPYLIADDVDYTFDNIYLVPTAVDLNNSDLLVKGRYLVSWTGGKSLSFLEGPGLIKTVRNSTVIVDGSRVNVSLDNVIFDHSTLEIRNSRDGGVNVNYGGQIYFKDSVLKGTNVSGYPLLGAGIDNSSGAHFEGSSRVETAAKTDYDRIGVNDADDVFEVLGGSYHVFTSSITNTNDRPTNGKDHGNEKLTYFQLADSSVASLDVIDKNGAHYTYPVATANEDGNKYVWVPAAKVNYELRDASATFSDGTKASKQFSAMRGQTLNAASQVNGKAQILPADPTATNGKTFAGWKYKDADGTEQAFDPANAVISEDTTVYATWKGNATVSVVAYANGANDAEPTTFSYPQGETVKVASYQDVLQQNPKFTKEGYHFDYWALDAAGKDRVEIGSELDVSSGSPVLYAVWAIDTYTVRFSANGGQFTDTSVFKTDATKDKFTIAKDASGGEVATLNEPVGWNTTLEDVFNTVGVSAKETTGQVTRQYFEPRYQKVCVSLFCFGKYGTYEDQHPWYTTAIASDGNRVDTSVKLTADTTFYAGWTPAKGVDVMQAHGLDLPGDLALTGGREATPVNLVVTGDQLTAIGSLNVESIKQQIEALGSQLTANGGTENAIATSGVTSTFTASFTLPKELRANVTKDSVKLTDNPLFEVSDVAVNGQTVTVTMTLKKAYLRFVDLKHDVTNVTDNGEPLVLTVPGIMVTGSADAGKTKDLTVTGQVTGTFQGMAIVGSANSANVRRMRLAPASRTVLRAATASNPQVRFFDFSWKASQSTKAIGNGTDPLADDDTTTIRDTVHLVSPVPVTSALTLPGNMTVNGEDSAITEVKVDQKATWVGQISTQPIKDQIALLAQQYCNLQSETAWGNGNAPSEACLKELGSINVDHVDSSFTATITLPNGVTPKANLTAEDVQFTANGLFEVSKVSQDGQSVTITMNLKKSGDNGYTKFIDLFNDVYTTSAENTPQVLEVTVPATVTADAATNTNLTATGVVKGSFTGLAWKSTGSMRQFNFSWDAAQTDSFGEKDAVGGDGITSTVYIVEPVLWKNHNLTIPGDLEISTAGAQDATTQADAVRKVVRGADYVYTGVISTQGIKDQISTLASIYCGDTADLTGAECQEKLAKISLSNVSSTFTATITLPEGISAKSSLKPEDVNFTKNGTFKVNSVKQIGNDVVISMSLVKEYKKFTDLFADITTADADHTPVQLTVDVPATVDTDATVNTNLTATGTVIGTFFGNARVGLKANTYDFVWTVEQTPQGLDSTLANANDKQKKAITLTVNAATRDIHVTKVWKTNDTSEASAGNFPEVTIDLLANGKETGDKLTLTAENSWKGSFEKVPVTEANGTTEVTYTIGEEALKGYTSTVGGSAKDGFIVTNTKDAEEPTHPDKPAEPSEVKQPQGKALAHTGTQVGILGLFAMLALTLGGASVLTARRKQ